jgi:hypothetical protein
MTGEKTFSANALLGGSEFEVTISLPQSVSQVGK